MSTSIKIIDNFEELISFEDKWKKFEKKVNHNNITVSYDWLSNWWSVFENVDNNELGYGKKLFIIVLYENDKLITIAPFVSLFRIILGIKIRFVEFLSQQWGGTYIDIINLNKTGSQRQEVFEYLYKRLKFDILHLKYIPENTYSFSKSELYLYSACPDIRIQKYDGYEEYKRINYSKNTKRFLKKSINRIERNKDKIQKKIEPITDSNFKEIIRISKSKLIDNKTWLYHDRFKTKFLKNIFNVFNSNVSILQINEKNVSYLIDIFFNNSKFSFDASYDRNFKQYNLGSLSVDLSIRDCFELDVNYYCIGPGLEFYKQRFTKNKAFIYMYAQKGNTFLSNLLYPIFKKMVQNKSKQFIKNQLLPWESTL